MKIKLLVRAAAALLLLGSMQAHALSVGVSFSKLTGAIGGTGVFKADLSSLPPAFTDLASITLRDGGGSDGSPGIWSGFDLDAVRLSTTNCADATCANGASSASAFDFVNALFAAGTLDPVPGGDPLAGPCLAGTTGCNVDNAKATMGAYDAAFASAPGSGFLSMGRGGTLGLNLFSTLALGGQLYLYVGEAGNNGETMRGLVTVSDAPAVVPVPAAVWLFGSALIGLVGFGKRRKAA
jgi:hypothetical protein